MPGRQSRPPDRRPSLPSHQSEGGAAALQEHLPPAQRSEGFEHSLLSLAEAAKRKITPGALLRLEGDAKGSLPDDVLGLRAH